jgi:hypothetical protein
VADGLQRYQEAAERAEGLDGRIEEMDRLIDESVYELYGLTDREITSSSFLTIRFAVSSSSVRGRHGPVE